MCSIFQNSYAMSYSL